MKLINRNHKANLESQGDQVIPGLRSRRNFLLLAASVAMGAGVLIASDGLLGSENFQKTAAGLAESIGATKFQTGKASLITVKAYYSMMTQYTNLTEEDFVLQSPATVQELIDTIDVRHPSMAQMMQSMMILLNGVAAKTTTTLNDGDLVQFIPLSAGG
jgi:molybdopterin converting factor small subunit